MKKNNTILIWPVLYIISMGIVNYICSRMHNTTYSDPNYIVLVTPFIAVMAALTIICFICQKDKLKLPWNEKGSLALFLIIFIPIVGMTLFSLFVQGAMSKAVLMSIIGTLCVGIAEEFMFRRILFIGVLNKGNLKRAVLISAIFFSLLHSVNVLSGVPIKNMFMQLIMTFIAGLYYAFMYLYTKNIYLLVAEHWLWDYLTVSVAKRIPWIGGVMVFLTLAQIIMIVIIARRSRTMLLTKNKRNI
ncbi:CPBP family intramembrane glutamic endopeptidase [Streptococcus catagoni]|uniref:CPBP family intramembrane glutamic endopeptidase n=1 Tax=Streptococcus catagoni TaxID=2654874 RepID=UPI00140770E4|nr:CPBP family intramembrane glutamic endopeptidase [Streptococcus catagoni]